MDPFIEFEQQVRQLMPVVLVGPALVLTAVGLVIWLAGIRLLKIIAALAGAAAGLLCAWHFTDRHLVPMVLLAVVPVVLSFFLHKPVVVLLAGVSTFAIVVFLPAALTGVRNLDTVQHRAPAMRAPALDLEQSIQQAEDYLSASNRWLVSYFQSVPGGQKSIAYMAALAVVGIGLFSWRLVCGAACSLLGVLMLSAGMTLLLFYKGAQPLVILKQNWLVIAWILFGMCIIGTLVQYWISPKKNKKQDTPKIHDKGGAQ